MGLAFELLRIQSGMESVATHLSHLPIRNVSYLIPPEFVA